jgi:hypothetical protein
MRAAIAILMCGLATASCYECKSSDPQCRALPDYQPIGPAPGPGDYPGPDGLLTAEPDGSEAAAASPCGRSCKRISELGCEEGQTSPKGTTCFRACQHMASLRRVPAECWAHASTVDVLRACGGVRCANVR